MSSRRLLDLSSTSQTQSLRCAYHAPLIALVTGGRGVITQGCCNHWDCPRCGQIRAKQEYRRIVDGAETLAGDGYSLYFYTLTCRGRELPLEEAQQHYYEWTNRLLTNARAHIGRRNPAQHWSYVQITERQSRGHPHSHIIATFQPEDGVEITDRKGREVIVSNWFYTANVSAGLGVQHEITLVKTPEAAARYVAKYMFKESMLTKWPEKWKRVRYSEAWPKLKPRETPEFVTVLKTPQQWASVHKTGVRFECGDEHTFTIAAHRIDNITLKANNWYDIDSIYVNMVDIDTANE